MEAFTSWCTGCDTPSCEAWTMRLILMRHAKSSWTEVGLTDHQRPLNARGRRDAPRMAAALHDLDMAPDLVLSSDSVRTRATWALMEDRFPEAEVRWLPSLYLASAHELAGCAPRWRFGVQDGDVARTQSWHLALPASPQRGMA